MRAAAGRAEAQRQQLIKTQHKELAQQRNKHDDALQSAHVAAAAQTQQLESEVARLSRALHERDAAIEQLQDTVAREACGRVRGACVIRGSAPSGRSWWRRLSAPAASRWRPCRPRPCTPQHVRAAQCRSCSCLAATGPRGSKAELPRGSSEGSIMMLRARDSTGGRSSSGPAECRRLVNRARARNEARALQAGHGDAPALVAASVAHPRVDLRLEFRGCTASSNGSASDCVPGSSASTVRRCRLNGSVSSASRCCTMVLRSTTWRLLSG